MDVVAVVVRQQADYWNYVGTGFGTVFVVISAYTFRTLRRGRRLSRQLPPDQRRWL